MAHTVAICALKGGVGKTTTAIGIAVCLHAAGRRVLLVDADAQASLRTWAGRAERAERDIPPVVCLEATRLRRDLVRLGESWELVLIDCPPQLGAETRMAMLAADLVLIPSGPGATDAWTLAATLALLEDARALRPELAARVVLTRADRTTLTTVARAALEVAAVPLMPAVMHARVAHSEATASGQGVTTYAPRGEAAREVRRLTRLTLEALR
jgi:chromosome partitioning protein